MKFQDAALEILVYFKDRPVITARNCVYTHRTSFGDARIICALAGTYTALLKRPRAETSRQEIDVTDRYNINTRVERKKKSHNRA